MVRVQIRDRGRIRVRVRSICLRVRLRVRLRTARHQETLMREPHQLLRFQASPPINRMDCAPFDPFPLRHECGAVDPTLRAPPVETTACGWLWAGLGLGLRVRVRVDIQGPGQRGSVS